MIFNTDILDISQLEYIIPDIIVYEQWQYKDILVTPSNLGVDNLGFLEC